MSYTVEDVARQTLASIDSDASFRLVCQWVAERFRQVASRARLRSMRRYGSINIPATITSGTVTATRDSALIVGDATAQAAWTGDVVGCHIRVSTSWYEIVAWDGANTLTIDAPFAEDTVTDGGYYIVKRFHNLPDDARHLGTFIWDRTWTALQRVSQAELDHLVPARTFVGYGPTYWCEAAPHLNLQPRRIEMYPYVTTSEVVHFTYWAEPPVLDAASVIPGDIPLHVLREGALIDLYRYEAGRQANAGNVDAAGFWRNESRAQKTQWETRDINDAIRADNDMDDVRFVAWKTGRTLRHGDIMTARDQVWSGSR